MKIKSFFVAVGLMAGVVVAPAQAADELWEIPKLVSFNFTPNEIDLTTLNPVVRVEVKVSHPIGIKSERIVINLRSSTNPNNFNYAFNATRTDSPISQTLREVTFVGSITLPTSMPSGVWNLSTDAIQGLAPARATSWPESTGFTSPNFRVFPGAENALLVRLNGSLDFDFSTFVGPTFSADTKVTDNKPISISSAAPIWRVNEIFDPMKYFEMRTNRVSLEISSSTPSVCSVTGNKLKLLATGDCKYKVFTSRSKDYLYKEFNGSSTVLSARLKPELGIPVIASQTVTEFPKSLLRSTVYFFGDPVKPISVTPNVCIADSMNIVIYSRGSCSLTYQTFESTTHLSSDLYTQTFEVIDANNPVVTPTPVATPTPTPTANPVVKKTITCIKGTKTIKRTAVSPKCPKGYKVKR
jgi:hypothetical protein